jgi:hypothetical protein
MDHAALMFRFPDVSSARMAADTLEELGYEPQLHEGARVHIHVENEDITSALEIVQSHGGQLMEHAPAEVVDITSAAYCLDSIPIPAHTVNEDWQEDYRDSDIAAQDGNWSEEARPTATANGEDFRRDDEPYDHFQAT